MVVAIIQARMGSTRLPGKVLKTVEGESLLAHLLSRVKRAKTLDKIVIATTDKPEDAAIAMAAEKLGAEVFRGSEEDVLDRYYQAAKKNSADDVVRLTGDCPLIDPVIVDKVIRFYLHQNKFDPVRNRTQTRASAISNGVDYVSNTNPPTYPDGMDTEIFSFKALEHAWKEAKLKSEREHVTPYIYNHPEIFKIKNVKYEKDVSDIRLTVDNPEDLELIQKIFGALYKNKKHFNLEDILKLLKENPGLSSTNRHIQRNEGYLKSLAEEKKNVIVVLGGAMKKGANGKWRTTNFGEKGDEFGTEGDRLRVLAASYLYKNDPRQTIIVLGGVGNLAHIQGAPAVSEVIKNELVELGVKTENIATETNSGSTFQQLRELNSMAGEKKFGKIIIISNKYHLPRTQAMIETFSDLFFLKSLLLERRIELCSAEEALIGENPGKWKDIIESAYASAKMKELMQKEEAGAAQIREGKYKFT